MLALAASTVVAPIAAQDDARSNPLYQGPLTERIWESGKLRAGVALFLPFVGQDPSTGEYFGTGVEIGQRMAEKLGVELELVPQDFSVIVAGIQSGQIDVAIAGLFITPERLQVIDMYPYATMGTCWIALATNDKINTLADLNSPDVTMAQIEGGGTYQLSRAKYPLAQQRTRLIGTGEELFGHIAEVTAGNADVAPFDSVLAPVVLADHPQLKLIPEDCPSSTDFTAGVSLGYPKADPGIHQVVQEVIAENRDAVEANLLKFSSLEFLRPQQ
ncbi:MAG: transporter substrate-binding domain-containing protein [Chloroflexi bacterium]|nr:transporter substrate-binding domain-containing protein [Chloroflexota bacterium]